MQILSRYKSVILVLVVILLLVIRFTRDPPDTGEPGPGPGDPWEELEYSSDAVLSLAKLALLPPPAPPSPSCSPPRLPARPSCRGHTGLTGHLLTEPKKLVLMMLFSFEVDTLEISLREQQDWVDMIFIVEATTTTKGDRKPLIWERVAYTERFSFVNMSKVFHVVMDDVVDQERVERDQWYHENTQTDIGVNRVKMWAHQSGLLDPDDIFISADVDEVMSPSALQALRWCESHEGVMFGGLWMPLGSLDRAYRSEFHLPGRPHTYTQPSIYRWGDLTDPNTNMTGWRLQTDYKEERSRAVAGGIHLTHSAFLPLAVLKDITATERRKRSHQNFFTDFYWGVTIADLDSQQDMLYRLDYSQTWLLPMLLDPLPQDDIEPTVPWFLACNKERYPYWYGLPDPRNQAFLRALQSGGVGGGGGGGEKKLYFQSGCFKTSGSVALPCLSGWQRINNFKDPNNDPAAVAWGKRIKE